MQQASAKDQRELKQKVSKPLSRHGESLFESGQALILLLFFMIFAVTITTTSAFIVITNTIAQSSTELGNGAYYVAESGIENAIIRLLRDPNYRGETLAVNQGTANITVTGTGNLTITSTGTLNSFIKKIQVLASQNSAQLIINSWREI